MAKSGAARHDGGLIDGHGVFGVIRNDGVARLVVGRDLFVLRIDLCTPSLWT